MIRPSKICGRTCMRYQFMRSGILFIAFSSDVEQKRAKWARVKWLPSKPGKPKPACLPNLSEILCDFCGEYDIHHYCDQKSSLWIYSFIFSFFINLFIIFKNLTMGVGPKLLSLYKWALQERRKIVRKFCSFINI